jgi:hypothetical protein
MEKYVDEHELVDPLIQLGKSEESNNGESNAPKKSSLAAHLLFC